MFNTYSCPLSYLTLVTIQCIGNISVIRFTLQRRKSTCPHMEGLTSKTPRISVRAESRQLLTVQTDTDQTCFNLSICSSVTCRFLFM